jgi:transposase InsO family protein
VLRRPLESAQYTSFDYTQTLDDHRVLASIGSVGDAYDNALAESFVDSFKTELIRDRVWRSRSQLELAIVEYVAWFNTQRLHSALSATSRQPNTRRSSHDARVQNRPID